ncbi:SH3 domain-containing protein [Peribacillus glennii]|uniref:N-acetylmuramoyl-L-alanine amidase n=1 Tax=Peribacillus glennii TaxID=2303991 RepID=A0A372LHR6_9BACI|nr:SH3 domain-containing protein [Peribacillus glennii]RFU65833.1 N-acetylmuramoyl-L-alanine amidase [Peribacillus glennii]
MAILHKGKTALYSLLFATALYPMGQAEAVENGEAVVQRNHINMREGPGVSYEVVEKIPFGMSFTIVMEENEWLKIRTSDGTEGWVAKWLAKADRNLSADSAQSMGKGIIKTEDVRVRTGPGTSHNLVGSLKQGSTVEILAQNGTWIQIKNQDLAGWILEDFIGQKTIIVNQKTETSAETVVTETINVRTHASLRGQVLGKLEKGSKVKINTVEGNWAKIAYNSAYGWVHKDYLSLSGSPLNDSPEEGSENERKNPGTKDNRNFIDRDKERNISPQISLNQLPANGEAVITQNGTNIRTRPDVQSLIMARTFVGDRFKIIGSEDDWYKIRLESGATGYVASWVVSVSGDAPRVKRHGSAQHLSDKLIVIDPGHGGRDRGTKGVQGTQEKSLTLETALILRDKLEAAGTTVILTRSSDYYLSLPARVRVSHYHNADAFISLHYDYARNHLVSGVTTYYYHSYQKSLAACISKSLGSSLRVINRGYRFGDYHVVRENEKAAALLELGYLSNGAEETRLNSKQYLESISTAIYTGLEDYFK